MGFPNVDMILKKIMVEEFKALQLNSSLAISDLFEDMTPAEQTRIANYLRSITITDDVRDRGDRRLFILPHFPLIDLPLPQIGLSVGEESAGERVLGDYAGEATPVADSDGTVIAWDIPHGYFANGSWNIDIVTASKDETVWLSRLCQYFICRSLDDLDGYGIKEISLSLTDIKIEQQTMQPGDFFARSIRMTGKAANTWIKRVSASYYQTGINLAL